MKKNKIGGYLKGVIIANLVLLGFLMLLVTLDSKASSQFSEHNFGLTITEFLIRDTFMIFASVLLVKLVIEEYKKKTITVLFLYPINRKKLLIAKLIIVGIFTFCSIIVSNIFVNGLFYLCNMYFNFVPAQLTMEIIMKQAIQIIVYALATVGISFIPLYFGMKKKSVSTTIISSVILTSIIGSYNNGYSLSSIIFIPISLATIGIFITYLSFRNIEHIDVT